ncbi:MAG: histidinol-phosphate transaminase [Candidatus Nitrosothermus koennekii]|nr:MAG: histidinol-phosphate transaminase [Candidatus Nitrosothermus koennekii]
MRWQRIIEDIAKLEGYKKPKIYANKLKLDTNENIAMPRSLVADILNNINIDVREYPTNYEELKDKLADYLSIDKGCIAIGNGSDQIIDLILASISKNDMSSITIKPTFSFYIARCKLHGINLKEISLDDNMQFDPNTIIDSDADICYISSPNNPTGNQFDKDDIISIIESFDGLVLIDEAYAEFARYSLKDLVNRYDNLIILRTMSKAFGLAGLRIGYAISNPQLIDIFNNIIQYPYPISSVAVTAAINILDRKDDVFAIIEEVKEERERIFNAITNLGLRAYRSDANFIMFEANDDIFNALLEEGIVIKDLGMINDKRCYRVSIGNKEINDRFISALRKVCS